MSAFSLMNYYLAPPQLPLHKVKMPESALFQAHFSAVLMCYLKLRLVNVHSMLIRTLVACLNSRPNVDFKVCDFWSFYHFCAFVFSFAVTKYKNL